VSSKPPLSIIDQINRLVERGIDAPDQDTRIELARLLTDNSYSRLARYWRYAQDDRLHGDRSFRPGVTVANLADSYRFDSALRRLLSQGLADFEITFRARLGYFMSVGGAAYTYRSQSTYRTLTMRRGDDARAELLDNIQRDLERSREEFITTALRLGDTPPLWDAMEVLTLGSVSKMYSLLDDEGVRLRIARSFGYPNTRIAESVFRSMTVVRNICAHHARIWNRTNVHLPPPVLNRLKTDPDQRIYQSTPWAWLVVLADLVDTIRRDDSYSSALWRLVHANPQFVDGLKRPRRA
jgi:abortive infection bacteriophage resistance protein